MMETKRRFEATLLVLLRQWMGENCAAGSCTWATQARHASKTSTKGSSIDPSAGIKSSEVACALKACIGMGFPFPLRGRTFISCPSLPRVCATDGGTGRRNSRFRSAPATQRLIFPRFGDAVGLRLTILCRPRRFQPECAVPVRRERMRRTNKQSCRASALAQEKERRAHTHTRYRTTSVYTYCTEAGGGGVSGPHRRTGGGLMSQPPHLKIISALTSAPGNDIIHCLFICVWRPCAA